MVTSLDKLNSVGHTTLNTCPSSTFKGLRTRIRKKGHFPKMDNFVETDVIIVKNARWICVDCLHEVDVKNKRHIDVFGACEIRTRGKINVAMVLDPATIVMTKVMLERRTNEPRNDRSGNDGQHAG